jgi:hypothetical protein
MMGPGATPSESLLQSGTPTDPALQHRRDRRPARDSGPRGVPSRCARASSHGLAAAPSVYGDDSMTRTTWPDSHFMCLARNPARPGPHPTLWCPPSGRWAYPRAACVCRGPKRRGDTARQPPYRSRSGRGPGASCRCAEGTATRRGRRTRRAARARRGRRVKSAPNRLPPARCGDVAPCIRPLHPGPPSAPLLRSRRPRLALRLPLRPASGPEARPAPAGPAPRGSARFMGWHNVKLGFRAFKFRPVEHRLSRWMELTGESVLV